MLKLFFVSVAARFFSVIAVSFLITQLILFCLPLPLLLVHYHFSSIFFLCALCTHIGSDASIKGN